MSVKGIVHYRKLVKSYERLKVYEDIDISFIWLSPDIDPNWPGRWWGRIELEGKNLDVWTNQKLGDTSETTPDNRVWRVESRFNYNPLEVNITDKDVNDFLVKQDILPTSLAIQSVRRHLAALAFAWASAEMQDASKGDVLEWIEWAKENK